MTASSSWMKGLAISRVPSMGEIKMTEGPRQTIKPRVLV